MPFRKSKTTSKAAKAKETVTEQVTDRTDDLVAALEAAKEALARASAAASRKGAELGKQASEAADKLLPERARQRKREAARRRNRRLLAGAAGLTLLGFAASRLAGPKGSKDRERLEREAAGGGGWVAESGADAGPAPSAEVTQLHTNGAGGDQARIPPTT
jgi:hypothetical protein